MNNQDFIKHCKNAVLLTLDFPMAAYPSSVKRKEHIEQVKQSLNVLCFVCEPKILLSRNPNIIRKLTPREFWRLQGFTDQQFEIAQALNSNAQLYKQAGNSVSIPIVYELGKKIIKQHRRLHG